MTKAINRSEEVEQGSDDQNLRKGAKNRRKIRLFRKDNFLEKITF